MNSAGPRALALRNNAESGMSTSTLRYSSVYPIESPNPGKTPRVLSFTAAALLPYLGW